MADVLIDVWENDPSNGLEYNGGTVITVDAPHIEATILPITIDQSEPPAGKYDQGTDGFRYWNLAAASVRATSFWSSFLTGVPWQNGSVLNIIMDDGEDLNSNYNREAVRFYHDQVSDKTVFTCESPDLVYHEIGHAVLDAIKPELWDSVFKEVQAFHEAFGDASAILCGLQIPSLRTSTLLETNNSIYSPCRISKFAKQLGWGLRQKHPNSVETDCYRNAFNSFYYQDTKTLLPIGITHVLTSASHSFSRVFTSALFEGLALMFLQHNNTDDVTLLEVSQDMAKILVYGVRISVATETFFNEVATKMVHVANAMFPNIKYGQALRSAFVSHGILLLSNTFEFANPLFPENFHFDSLLDNNIGSLKMQSISISEYEMGINNILVQVPRKIDYNQRDFQVATKSFIESLITKNRLKTDEMPLDKMNMKILRPTSLSRNFKYTHELKKEGSEYILQRLYI